MKKILKKMQKKQLNRLKINVILKLMKQAMVFLLTGRDAALRRCDNYNGKTNVAAYYKVNSSFFYL